VFNMIGASSGGAGVTEKTAIALPAVLRALEILSGLFAMTPLIYYRRLPDGGKERATESPLYALLHDRPNNVQDAFRFKEALLLDLLLRAGFYSYVHRDAAFRPSAISRLSPIGAAVAQHWDEKDGLELFYDVQLPNGLRRRLSRADCWHIPGFSLDGVTGVNRIHAVRDALAGAIATSEYAARFWENNAQPSTVLTTKHKVEPEAKNKIRADWKALFGGQRRAGETAVLDQEMDLKVMSLDNKASQHIETRQFSVFEVARCFGVPPHLLFELSRATFSNIEHQSLEFVTFHMGPHYERVASAATHYFAEPGCFFEFLPDALLKGDLKSRLEAYGMAIDKGIMNPNEARARENLNKREGGDEYRLGSGSTLESAPPEPGPAQRTPEPPEDEED
jgi:HK97 family phage portal protein